MPIEAPVTTITLPERFALPEFMPILILPKPDQSRAYNRGIPARICRENSGVSA
jgi:hypothetical protein